MDIFTCCFSSFACCFTQTACKLCCSSLPECRYSTSTRIAYTLCLAVVTIFSYISTSRIMQTPLLSIKSLCNNTDANYCTLFVGYEAAYRIQFAMFIFFLIMAFFTIAVKDTTDIRAYLHNGLWFLKFLLIFGLIYGMFSVVRNDQFNNVIMITGIVASFIYILIQLVLLIEFSHSWNEKWVERGEENTSWLAGILYFSFFMTGLSIACIICMYIYLTNSETCTCAFQKLIISLHLIISFVLFVVSLLPQIQEAHKASGILQPSTVFFYTTYLILIAIGLKDDQCNRMLPKIGKENFFLEFQSIFNIIFSLFMLGYSCSQTSYEAHILLLKKEEYLIDISSFSKDLRNTFGQKIYDDEFDGVSYHYSIFHLLLALSSLYLMMSITNWYNPLTPTLTNSTKGAMWVKIVSAWSCQLLYFTSLVSPLIFKNREI